MTNYDIKNMDPASKKSGIRAAQTAGTTQTEGAYGPDGAPTWIPGFNGTTVSPLAGSVTKTGGSNTQTGGVFQNAGGKQVTQTTGILPDGQNANLYLIDGVTYKDPEGKSRIDYKTRVNTADGQYVYMPGGSYRVTGTIDPTPTSTPVSAGVKTQYQAAGSTAPKAGGARGPVATTYIDENGKAQTGYIIGGVTYKDAAGKNRIGAGSIVNTGGGSYLLGQDGRGVAMQSGNGFQDTFSYGGRMYQVFRNQYGQAFVDPECTTPVPTGAQLSMGGATYTQNGSYGMIPTPQGIIYEYGQRMQQVQDAERQAYAAQQNLSAENLRQQLARIEDQRRKLQQEYMLANQTSYNAYRDAVNPYGINAEQIAALGLDESGFAETSMVAMINSYQQALAGNERDRLNALAELELAANEAILEGNRADYEAYATMYRNISSILMQGASETASLGMQAADMARDDYWRGRDDYWRGKELEKDEYQFGKRMELEERQLEKDWAELDERKRQAKWQEAMELVTHGMAPAQVAQILGIPQRVADQVAQQYFQK